MRSHAKWFGALALLVAQASQSALGAQALEEVIVTATKRSESVQDVPISIGVVSAEMMDTFNIGDITDIQNFVPGLQVQETFGGTAIRIRGLGSGITNLAFDSSVPIFVDDVYSGRSNSALSAILDPGRVEVARGPQGALFGKSTTAGAISVTSARPTAEFESQIKLGHEFEYGGNTLSGFVSGPLSENARGRVAVYANDTDGWTKNLATGQDDGSEETRAARASLELDLSDRTSVYLKAETGTKDSDGRNNQPVSGTIFPPVGPFLPFIANQTAEIDAGTLEFVGDETRGVSTGFPREDYSEYDWSNFTFSLETEVAAHEMVLIANYNDYNNVYFLDVDGFAANVLNTWLNDDYEATSLELRFLSDSGRNFEYIGGLWYQSTTTKTRQWASYGSGAPAPVVGLPDLIAITSAGGAVGTDRNYNRDVDAFSVYGQLTFNLSDQLSAILDLRYTKEDQDARGTTRRVLWTDFNDWTDPALNPDNQTTAYTFVQSRGDSSFDPSLRVQYVSDGGVMVYGAYAHGSKAGGTKANDSGLSGLLLSTAAANGDAWAQAYTGVALESLTGAYIGSNTIRLKEGNGVFDFEDEEADSYELGFKSTLADGAVFLNGAVFTTEYKNLQTSSFNGTVFVIGNAGQATIDGVELELNWQASEHLRLNAGISYIDATYDSYPGASCVLDANLRAVNADCSAGLGNAGQNGNEDQAGEPLERSPDLEVNVSAMWNSAITDRLDLKVSGALYHSGEYFIQPTQEPYSVQDAYTKLDLRVALAGNDDQWEVALNARNLTDELVISHAYRVFSRFQSLTRGRTISLDAVFRF